MTATMPAACVTTDTRAAGATVASIRSCGRCRKPYAPKVPWQEFCADKCRLAAWNAQHPRVSRGHPRPATRKRRGRADRRRDLLAEVAAIGRVQGLPATEVLRVMLELCREWPGLWAAVEAARQEATE